jgi:hypothetical protein
MAHKITIADMSDEVPGFVDPLYLLELTEQTLTPQTS